MNMIIENGSSLSEIPVKLRSLLKVRFKEQRRFLFNFAKEMAENPFKVIAKLSRMKAGDSVIFQTNFHEKEQMEMFINLASMFMSQNIQLNFYIVFGKEKYKTLEEAITEYLDKREAYVNPRNVIDRVLHKQNLNNLLLRSLRFHNMYVIKSKLPSEDERITLQTKTVVTSI